MFTFYECPECHLMHDDPAEAAYVVAVRCLDCALDEALFEQRALARELAKAA